MTNYYHKKGNRIVKYAFLDIIENIMKSNAVASFTWLNEGYENDNQRIQFKLNGCKYRLEGVGCPNTELGIIKLKVTRIDDKKVFDWTFDIGGIRIKTLEKIACEVYNTLWNPEEDEEWDDIRNNTIEYYLDTFFYPEMKLRV